mmetsp:Transcript_7009/g.14927  ORF Transcript_7009/g.14927 Transcript_7009/m.14927 type:complete len:269 (+) Transcript_7009:224-1030(+)
MYVFFSVTHLTVPYNRHCIVFAFHCMLFHSASCAYHILSTFAKFPPPKCRRSASRSTARLLSLFVLGFIIPDRIEENFRCFFLSVFFALTTFLLSGGLVVVVMIVTLVLLLVVAGFSEILSPSWVPNGVALVLVAVIGLVWSIPPAMAAADLAASGQHAHALSGRFFVAVVAGTAIVPTLLVLVAAKQPGESFVVAAVPVDSEREEAWGGRAADAACSRFDDEFMAIFVVAFEYSSIFQAPYREVITDTDCSVFRRWENYVVLLYYRP